MAIDISSCLTAIQSMKSKVAGCFSKCAEKGSTFNGTQTLSNLQNAISMIPSSVGILPDGYKQLEYIESTGTQYIDTGYSCTNNSRVELTLEICSDSAVDVFGSRDASSRQINTVGIQYSSNQTALYFNNRDDDLAYSCRLTVRNSELGGLSNRKLTFIMDKYIRAISDENGDILASNVTECTEDILTSPVFIFDFNNSSSPPMEGKLYSCKIYDNGTLIRDFIPCKNPSGVVGLYDLVNDVFYSNSGTGTFIAGAVVQGLDGASFSGFDITYGDNTYTINFGSIGVSWKSIVCYSDTKDGHFAIHKMSNNKCVISGAVFYDASNQFDEAFGIFPNQRNTYRATYLVSGNSITFTNAEYDGTSNGMTNHDTFGAMPQQVSTDVNDYFTNQYKLDRITVVI